MSLRALITDLDNTLYDWVSFVVPALEAMVESLRATTGLAEAEIIRELHLAYAEEETAEYAFVLQRSGLMATLGLEFTEFSERIIRPAQKAFSIERNIHLKLYPGVPETLRELKNRGVRIYGLTDAPAFPAAARLKKLGLDVYFEGLYTLENYLPPVGPDGDFLLDPEIRERLRRGDYEPAFGKPVELAKAYEKPSPLGIRKILFDHGLRTEEVLMVGDNPRKDLAAAAAAGVRGVHAAYGSRHAPALIARLQKLTPGSLTARHRSTEPEAAPAATLVIEEFAALLEITQKGLGGNG